MEELTKFYPPEEARRRLISPHRLLRGETPADKIQRGEFDDVLTLLEQLRDSIYLAALEAMFAGAARLRPSYALAQGSEQR